MMQAIIKCLFSSLIASNAIFSMMVDASYKIASFAHRQELADVSELCLDPAVS